jgi:hypothetical protein
MTQRHATHDAEQMYTHSAGQSLMQLLQLQKPTHVVWLSRHGRRAPGAWWTTSFTMRTDHYPSVGTHKARARTGEGRSFKCTSGWLSSF